MFMRLGGARTGDPSSQRKRGQTSDNTADVAATLPGDANFIRFSSAMQSCGTGFETVNRK
jgi:hypothetical protein